MPDDGHPLRFGSFITPVKQPAAHAVGLSRRSEDLGLDLVTFQDHPYRAELHDTWTLLLWVAATTTRIQVAGNVLNLPMRDPAVLARSVASLDLLSGGRVSLGLGAYKPRMLRLTGRKTDGWVLGLPALRPGDLAPGNGVIDQAALAAGRHPEDITRLLNVTAGGPAAELARLAVEDGVSVFILLSDDPDALRHFAERMVPEIRDRLGEARQQSDRAAPSYRVGGGATRRVPAVGNDPVPRSLAAGAVLPGEAGYERYTASYFRGGAPALVLRPGSPAEVQDAVRFAARHRDLPLGLLSGGHGLSGRSLNHGGIVTADGALVHASDEENTDLFWAMRGAGANFGVAVSLEFDARPIGEIVVAQLVFAVDDLSAFLQRWGTAVEDADRTVSATLMFGPTASGQQATVQALVVVDSDDPDLALTRLRRLAAVAPLVHQSAQLTGYDALLAVPPWRRGPARSRRASLPLGTPPPPHPAPHRRTDGAGEHRCAARRRDPVRRRRGR